MKKDLTLPTLMSCSLCVSYLETVTEIKPSKAQGTVYINASAPLTVQVGNHVFPFLQADALYASPFCECRVLDDAQSAIGVYALSLDPSTVSVLAPSLLRRATVGQTRLLFDRQTSERVLTLCQELLDTSDALALHRACSLFSFLEQERLSKAEENYQISLPLTLRRILSYIDEHLAEPINADTLALRYGVSGDTVRRLFREFLGETVRSCVLRKRALRVAFLHHHGNALDEVLVTCGFATKKGFFDAYKEIYGTSLK